MVRGHPCIPLLCNTAISIALFISSGRSVHHIPHPLRSLSPPPLLNLSSREQRLHWMWHRAIWFGFGRAVALAVEQRSSAILFSNPRISSIYRKCSSSNGGFIDCVVAPSSIADMTFCWLALHIQTHTIRHQQGSETEIYYYKKGRECRARRCCECISRPRKICNGVSGSFHDPCPVPLLKPPQPPPPPNTTPTIHRHWLFASTRPSPCFPPSTVHSLDAHSPKYSADTN